MRRFMSECLLRKGLLISLALFLSACGSQKKETSFFDDEIAEKKPKIKNQLKLKKNWSVKLGAGISQGDAILSPVLSGDFIYAAAKNGKVEKINRENGKSLWTKKLKKIAITAGVGVGGGIVVIGTENGKIYALNQSSGDVVWQTQLSTEVLSTPVVDQQTVIARAGDGKVYGISSYNGEVEWVISRQLPKLTLRGDSKPLLFQGVAVIGFSDGTLAAVEAKTGRAIWDFPISFPRGTNEIDRLSDIDTTPLLVGNFIYVSSYQEVTHALDIAKQKIAWSADISSFHPLAFDAAYLYITDKKGEVHQIDRSTGSKNWTQSGLKYYGVSGPVSLGSFVLIGDGDGLLFVMDKTDGNYIARFNLGAKRIVGDVIVDSQSMIFMDSDGRLQSVRLVENK